MGQEPCRLEWSRGGPHYRWKRRGRAGCNVLPFFLKYLTRADILPIQEGLMTRTRTACFALALAGTLAAQLTPAAARARYSGMVVFGTSLSDSGNAFALRGGTNTPPDYLLDPLLVPSAPYARGGHHFNNRATWIEQYARSIALAGSAHPAFQSASQGTNYAVGAARAYEDGVNVNLSAQVDAFLQDVGGGAPSEALYAIEMGSNDIRDALVAYPTGHEAILQAANISIATNIGRLY